MKNKWPSLLLAILIASCGNITNKKAEAPKNNTGYYTEAYRPQFHFSPKEKWMNDPNGLVYNEGVYHLFYQYYPEDIVWGPMHWGHAVSRDMVHWQHRPIALYPDENGLIFSGSAVVDKNNTSGFGKDGIVPLVAIFTYHLMEGERAGRNDFQTQGIAYSLDNGDTWIKYGKNPVIGNEGIRDFRDPKVFWHEPTASWIMALVAGDHAKFYRSKNLKDWHHLSDFGKDQGAHGGVWECPDLIKFRVEGTDEEKWVLIISINPGAPNGGSGTQYFVGDFDGITFTSAQSENKWLDWGTDNYAGVTYNNTPKNEHIFIGWMSNWSYARDTPTEKWRSAMTLPRNLTLVKDAGDYFLKNYPVEELMSLAEDVAPGSFEVAANESKVTALTKNNQAQLVFFTDSKDFVLSFTNNKGEILKLMVDDEVATLDRTKSGKTDFQVDFGKLPHKMPLVGLAQGPYEVRVFLDWSSIEVVVDGGKYVMTDQIFPTAPYSKIIFTNNGSKPLQIKDFSVMGMNSIW